MKRYEEIRARAWMQTFVMTCLTLSAINLLGVDEQTSKNDKGISEESRVASQDSQPSSEWVADQADRRQTQQQNLNYVGQAISYTGDAFGLKSQGWLLPKDQETGNSTITIDFSEDSFDPKNPEHYNAYYGVKFGPTFFKLYDSAPNFLKSWDGFAQASADFFSVFTVRFNHVFNPEDPEERWTNAAKNGWARFIQACTNRFENGKIVVNQGMMQLPSESNLAEQNASKINPRSRASSTDSATGIQRSVFTNAGLANFNWRSPSPGSDYSLNGIDE